MSFNSMRNFHLSLSVLALVCSLNCTSSSKKNQTDSSVYNRLTDLGLALQTPTTSKNSFVSAVRSGNLIFMSGKVSKKQDGSLITGKLGKDLTVEQGYEAARFTAIQQLEGLQAELGDLTKVKRIVKVLGMVNSTPDFYDQPKVINGFSDLMISVFGDKGKHARSAVGMASLPSNVAVEVEMIVEVYPD
jgi:enamine deaminase RidA (YjgF/YER057c/UK114 family)